MTNWIRTCCLVIYPEIIARHRNSKIITVDGAIYSMWTVFSSIFSIFSFFPPPSFCLWQVFLFALVIIVMFLWLISAPTSIQRFQDSPPVVHMPTRGFSVRLLPNHQAVKMYNKYTKRTLTSHYIIHVGDRSVTLTPFIWLEHCILGHLFM